MKLTYENCITRETNLNNTSKQYKNKTKNRLKYFVSDLMLYLFLLSNQTNKKKTQTIIICLFSLMFLFI